ncbi:MAG TPA: LysM domain-containing protein [Acidimicrobiales bacterium]|nr:LysM domain-containing protein [Acidimicrobiales bacterium]
MAALVVGGTHRLGAAGRGAHLRLLEGGAGARRPARDPRQGAWRARARSAVAGLATLGALVGLWFGAGALRSLGARPAASQVGGGSCRYVVREGDTLWSIATRAEPGGDPRPLVDRLAAQVHGAVLLAGSELAVPCGAPRRRPVATG